MKQPHRAALDNWVYCRQDGDGRYRGGDRRACGGRIGGLAGARHRSEGLHHFLPLHGWVRSLIVSIFLN